MKTFTKNCIVCGKEFTKNWQKKFCSRDCYYSWAKENPNTGCFKRGNTTGFQKGHKIYDGVKKGWFKKGHTTWNKDRHIKTNNALEVWRKNGGENWLKGKSIKMNNALDKWREKGGESPSGKDHWNWKNDKSKLSERIRKLPASKLWRKAVFEQDNYICQICKKRGGKLHPHHKKRFSIILKENNITSVKKAKSCKELWDIGNGQTLCIPCHKQTMSYLKDT